MASNGAMDEPLSGTELALEDLHWLRALAARLVRDPHLADDAVQETLVAALERRPRAAGSLRAWLGAILRNALRQEWRGRARRARREEQAGPARNERSTLEVIEELTLHRRLVERVEALDEPYRTVVVLRYLRGREVAEIAHELGVPEKTVRTRLARAIEQLRRRMGAERQAWLALLFPCAPPALSPALPALLLPMKLKALAAVLVLCLVGAFLYLRSAPSLGEQAEGSEPKLAAATPVVAPTLAAPPASGDRAVQSSPTSQPLVGAPQTAPLEVRGFVRTLDGHGLADLEVVFEPGAKGLFAQPAGTPGVKTGSAGEFALPCPETAGRLDLRSEEYVGLVLPQLEGTVPIAVPVLVAAPLRSYSGVVLDEGRTPIAGAHVEITLDGSFVQSRDVGGQAVHILLPFAETVSDEAGAFRFERAGFVAEASLVASAHGYTDARIALPAAAGLGNELVLARKPSGPRTLIGIVLDANEAPVTGAQVSLGGTTVESDGQGRFRLECEAWRKDGWIRAYRPGQLPAELALETALEESAHERPVVLHIGAEPRSIRGHLLEADGTPAVGACVWTPDTTPFGEIVLREGENSFTGGTTVEALLNGNTQPWASQVSTRTDAEGQFTLSGLLDRSYMLFALDGRTLEGLGPVEAVGGDENVLLRLGHSPRTAVAGRVVSRAGVPLAGVTVTPGRRFDWRASESPAAGRWLGYAIGSPAAAQVFPEKAVVTDAEGRFALPRLVPHGAYLALRGKPLVLGDAYELDRSVNLEALEIAVDASSRFRISLARAAEADTFRLEEADGELVSLYLEVEGVTISAGSASIDRGQSGVVLTSEGEHVLVLLVGAEEVRRTPLHFPAGGLHELRP